MAKAKVITGIDCDTFAAESVRLVLKTRLKELCDLRAAALDWSDPEGVHDMRVASRRLRGALSDFMPYLHKRSLGQSLKEIKNIADALGEVRDQDVAIKALERLAGKAREEVAAKLSEIIEERKRVREKARKELRRMLRKQQLHQLEENFSKAIDAATEEPKRRKPNMKDASILSYRTIARSVILERLRELNKLSSGFYRPLETEPLHKLRIAAKRLRYAIELFEQCWGNSLTSFAKTTADLQTSLGDLHDCDVWIKSFGERLAKAKKKSRARTSPNASPNSLAASSTGTSGDPSGSTDHSSAPPAISDSRDNASAWLLNHFVKVRSKHFQSALTLWSDWEANCVSAELEKCLKAHRM